MQLVMHSYTFRRYSLREAFVNARRLGWDGIELQPCHFDRERIETELPEAVALGGKLGVPILCVDSGGDFIQDDGAAREAEVRRMERDIEACARCGVSLINGGVGGLVVDRQDYGKNGSALAKDVHYERAADAMRHLGALAAKRSITIVFEIHMNGLVDTIASTARLLDLIGLDNVKANPEIKQNGIKRMNDNLRQVIEKYKYMEFLESIEKDLYDENEVLIEARLEAAYGSNKFPLPPPMRQEAQTKDPYIFLRAVAMIPVIFRIILVRLKKRLSGKKGW